MSLSLPEALFCIAAILLAYGLRGSTGFGGAVGLPLLALVVPMKILVPVWTLLGFVSSVAILGRERHEVAWRQFIAFIPWCVGGSLLGLYFFKTLDAVALARGLGVLVLIYAATTLITMIRARPGAMPMPRVIAPLAAALSGVVGTVFGAMASIFFAMYLDTHPLTKSTFRATTSAMLLALSGVRGIGYFAVGEFTADAFIAFSAAFPVMLLGIYVGDRIHIRISEAAFKRLVCFTLFLCGIPLLLK